MFYFVTITMNPRWFKQTPEDQYDILKNELTRELKYIKEHKTLVFELTKAFNIHAHGMFYLRRRRELHDLFRGNKVVGFIKVEQPNNYELCMNYIFKNVIDFYKDISLKHPVIWNETMHEYRLHDGMPQIKSTKDSLKDELLALKIEKMQLREEIKDLNQVLDLTGSIQI